LRLVVLDRDGTTRMRCKRLAHFISKFRCSHAEKIE
jgi:hypothetical protein